jgi:hypothetical protein
MFIRKQVSVRFAALDDLDAEEEINSAWQTIREYQNFSQRGTSLF